MHGRQQRQQIDGQHGECRPDLPAHGALGVHG
jgi:hypothetical protein